MLRIFIGSVMAAAAIAVLIGCVSSLLGDGALKRHMTMSGIYAVCKPKGYPVVCFLDADGKDGGMFCVPLSGAGGNCL